jgi:hypothetical protein
MASMSSEDAAKLYSLIEREYKSLKQTRPPYHAQDVAKRLTEYGLKLERLTDVATKEFEEFVYKVVGDLMITAYPPTVTVSVSHPPNLPVYVDPGDASPELLTEFYVALSAVYRSLGGSGLEVAGEQCRVVEGELQ